MKFTRKFLEQFRQTAAGVRDTAQAEIDKIDREIEALRRERDIVLSLPLPRDEIIADFESSLDALHSEWVARFRHRVCDDRPAGPKALLAPNSRAVTDMTFPPLLNLPTVAVESRNGQIPPESPPADHLDLTCLLGLLAEPLKLLIRRSIEGIDWPEETGLPREARKRRVAELDAKIKARETKRLELIQTAREAGIYL